MSVFGNLTDNVTNKSLFVDNMRNLRVESAKRILGSNFGSTIDTTYTYTTTPVSGGTATATNSVLLLATNTTANGAITIVSKNKARYLAGRANIYRGLHRFGDTGTTNNVREFGVQVDANNKMVFRLSATTFSVVLQRAGSETVVTSGSFNGNGLGTGGTYTVDTNFHTFEILYTTSAIRFIIDDVAIHTFKPATTSLIVGTVGTLYASNTNSASSTTSTTLDTLAWSISQLGDSINNPNFYNINAVAETRTLKSGGGTLQSIQIGRNGGANATLTLYDNTAGSGTIINIFDLSTIAGIGNQPFGVEGVNFFNGLTYVTSGTMTAASVSLFWE